MPTRSDTTQTSCQSRNLLKQKGLSGKPSGAGWGRSLADAGLCGQGPEHLHPQALSLHQPNDFSRYKTVPEAVYFLLDTHKQSLMISMAYCYFYILSFFKHKEKSSKQPTKCDERIHFRQIFAAWDVSVWRPGIISCHPPGESSTNSPGQHLFLKYSLLLYS